MIQIRNKVFETNSSMTHSLVICSQKNYDDWKNGKAMFKEDGESFLPNDEARKYNADQLRETLKWYKEKGHKFNEDILNEDTIKSYEEGKLNNDHWGLFPRYDANSMYITFEQWRDYVSKLGFEYMSKSSNINDIKVIAFGYYGHD
jgi:hypothetical protein